MIMMAVLICNIQTTIHTIIIIIIISLTSSLNTYHAPLYIRHHNNNNKLYYELELNKFVSACMFHIWTYPTYAMCAIKFPASIHLRLFFLFIMHLGAMSVASKFNSMLYVCQSAESKPSRVVSAVYNSKNIEWSSLKLIRARRLTTLYCHLIIIIVVFTFYHFVVIFFVLYSR